MFKICIVENKNRKIMKTQKLNDAQMVLLQLFQNRKMNQVEIGLLKDVLVNHLTNELDLEIDNVMNIKGLTPQSLEKRTSSINQNRTQYL
jgi:hypothetical protein